MEYLLFQLYVSKSWKFCHIVNVYERMSGENLKLEVSNMMKRPDGNENLECISGELGEVD